MDKLATTRLFSRDNHARDKLVVDSLSFHDGYEITIWHPPSCFPMMVMRWTI